MEQKLILYPMFALVGWTFLMMGVMLQRAFKAVGAGLKVSYFRYGSGAEPPGYMRAAYQHYANLFEMPVLFYAAVLTGFLASVVDAVLIVLAWAYVAVRMLHSVIHLQDRNVMRRRDSFLASAAVLLALWLVLVFRVAQSA